MSWEDTNYLRGHALQRGGFDKILRLRAADSNGFYVAFFDADFAMYVASSLADNRPAVYAGACCSAAPTTEIGNPSGSA